MPIINKETPQIQVINYGDFLQTCSSSVEAREILIEKVEKIKDQNLYIQEKFNKWDKKGLDNAKLNHPLTYRTRLEKGIEDLEKHVFQTLEQSSVNQYVLKSLKMVINLSETDSNYSLIKDEAESFEGFLTYEINTSEHITKAIMKENEDLQKLKSKIKKQNYTADSSNLIA